MTETPLDVAASLLEEERHEMVASAQLLHRRLDRLISSGGPGVGFELNTIVSMLGRMRDSVESYRTAAAVVEALKPLSKGGE